MKQKHMTHDIVLQHTIKKNKNTQNCDFAGIKQHEQHETPIFDTTLRNLAKKH